MSDIPPVADTPVIDLAARAAVIAAALQAEGWLALPDFLDPALQLALLADCERRRDQFAPAAVGRGSARRVVSDERNDVTLWLDEAIVAQQMLLQTMVLLREELNRRLFLGLSDYEAHYAHYAPGTFYRRHRDAFAPAPGTPPAPRRILSSVTYLNHAEGGELVLWGQGDDEENELARVAATAGTAVFFMSAEFPHEVLPAQSDCYLIAGWFRGR